MQATPPRTRDRATLRATSRAGAIALGCAAGAFAQPGAEPPVRPVDQGFSDAEPLSTSLLLTPIDLRQPQDFRDLYHNEATGLYYRVSGGLIAAFPRSEYAADGSVLIPPGTEFYIGPPLNEQAGLAVWAAPAGSAANPVSNLLAPGEVPRVDYREEWGGSPFGPRPFAAASNARAPVEAAPVRSVWTDEAYRRARLAALLELPPATASR